MAQRQGCRYLNGSSCLRRESGMSDLWITNKVSKGTNFTTPAAGSRLKPDSRRRAPALLLHKAGTKFRDTIRAFISRRAGLFTLPVAQPQNIFLTIISFAAMIASFIRAATKV
jgi:hypothetical protein